MAGGVITIDRRGTIVSVNKAACIMFRYTADEMPGLPMSAICDPSERGRLGRDFAALKARTGDFRETGREFVALRKDGSTFEGEVLVSSLTLESERGYIGIVHDISERKAAERLKNEFVSTVSHELRTPLTSINGSLGLISAGVAGTIPAAAAELLRIAVRNCERLVRLVNDILDTEKLASGRMPFDMKIADLGMLVAHAVRANEGFAAAHNVTLAFARGATPVLAEVDADRFEQLLTNLLSNAVKFSPEGGTVEIALAADPGHAHISVRDHGPGIPAEFQPRMFQRFAQADGSDQRKKGGTGLGLHIAKAIAERLGGTIGFETAPGAGTTFHVRLPLADTRDTRPAARAAQLQEA
jgi:PAS domain S-box-containing protein